MNEGRYTGTELPSQLIPQGTPYILWLASWYPTKTVPNNGDFIQRHAYAVSIYHQIVLVHTIHDPNSEKSVYFDITKRKNLIELIIYFPDPGPGNSIFDKIGYNIRYYEVTRKIINDLFRNYSYPTFVHLHVPMKMGIIALWIKKRWKIPFLVSEQSASYLREAPDHYFSRNWYFRNCVKQIFKNALAVTNVSENVGSGLQKVFSISRLFVVRNTVDEKSFYFKEKSFEKFQFIHVSTLSYQKNTEGLIKSFEIFADQRNDVELIMVGPVSANIRDIVNNSSVSSKITMTGEIPYEEVASRMQASNCFVLFSRYENFPCVIIEALCCGLPVITSNTGGAGEALDHTNGIVISSGDEAELVIAMSKIMAQYQSYNREKISQEARAEYNYSSIGMKFNEVYKTLQLLENK